MSKLKPIIGIAVFMLILGWAGHYDKEYTVRQSNIQGGTSK